MLKTLNILGNRLCKLVNDLHSKARFISAQYDAYLDGVWSDNARHGNAMALRLAKRIEQMSLSAVRVTRPVETNAVFMKFNADDARERVGRRFVVDYWEPPSTEIRLMTSFKTTEAEVDELANVIANK